MLTVHLIDASPYLFRAFFSLPRTMVDGKGRPNNAVYGFTKFVEKYIADHDPTHIAVAFDRHFNQSFRNEFYPPYKAHREKSPPELDAQVDPSLAAMESMGVATFIDETHEADDLIATIIAQTRDDGAHYVIVTSDKDLTQLVCDRVTWFDAAKKVRLDAEGVKAKFGVRPDQITDFLGLAGDSVDNIPGVRGIGPKTAAELLRKYGSLEAICADRPSMRETEAELSKRLATVSVEAPIRVTLGGLRLVRGVSPES
jgi:5'-3' exonuclease